MAPGVSLSDPDAEDAFGEGDDADDGADDGVRKLSRAEKKERTRVLLIEAAAELALSGGVAAVTTTAVTARIGVTQPAFYVHFKNVDEILAVAASETSDRITKILREVRAKGRARGPIENSKETVRSSLEALCSEPEVLDMFLRYRRDTTSALGNSIMACEARARQELAEDLGHGAAKVGLSVEKLPPLNIVADCFASLFIGCLESIRDGRATLEQAASMLSNVLRAAVMGAVMKQSSGS